jgi:hypothetical protein
MHTRARTGIHCADVYADGRAGYCYKNTGNGINCSKVYGGRRIRTPRA